MKFSLFVIFIFSSLINVSQSIEFDKKLISDKKQLSQIKRDLKDVDVLMTLSRYDEAFEILESLNTINSDNSFVIEQLGICQMKASYVDEAIATFSHGLEVDVKHHILHYYLGKANQLQGDFDEASDEYKAYRKYSQEIDVLPNITQCKLGVKLKRYPVKVDVKNLGEGINCDGADYSPLISADGNVLIYTSRRKENIGSKIDGDISGFFDDIYIAERVDGVWNNSKNIGKPINTENHDATIGLSVDGQTLLIYNDKDGSGDFYQSVLKGDQWSNPVKMHESINSEDNEYSATFSPDGRMLFFVSDREGGFGGKDVYRSIKTAEGWSPAINLGRNINTSGDEDGVFMHSDGKTFYFSSNGQKTIGGYDIFKSTYNKKKDKWSKVKNLGYPINTAGDDIFFVMAADGKRAYYTSKKSGGLGSSDIYEIVYEANDTTAVDPSLALLKGIVSDVESNLPIESQIDIVDNVSGKIISTFNSNSKTGKYLISLPFGTDYGISVNAENYLFYSANINFPDSADFLEIEKNIQLSPIKAGESIVLKNIFFDTGSITLRNESKSEIDRLVVLMNNSPKIKVEIAGYTDNIGSKDSNLRLSEQRAESVMNYMVSQKIPSSRIVFKGYGGDSPIDSNDTKEGRQNNRRTEFKVVSVE